jgi:16S rRNA (cytosine967-C5)-methyltransferase
MISPARIAAYHALRAVSARRSDLPAALARARLGMDDERDRALAAQLATGTLRWQGQVDYLIEHYARRPLERLDPEVVDILRLGIYQLLHLNRVPAAAAVSDAVALTRRAGKTSAASFVNAILRTVSRGRRSLPLPARPAEIDETAHPLPGVLREAALAYLSVTLSHPRWLAARWLDRHGFAVAEEWERFNNAPAPLTLRLNRLKTDPGRLIDAFARESVTVAPARYAPDGFVVVRGRPLDTPLATTGWYFVQDEASQLVALLGTCRPGERVLDACASPGGKTTAMAAAMHDQGLLVAADARARRVGLLRRTVVASGAHCVRIAQADLSHPLPFGTVFDMVLVDAPCSGLGTIRRDPEVRWRRAESDLSRFATAQLEMLANAAQVVRVAGRVVYATCSSEPEENDAVVEAFLRTNRSFCRIDPRSAAGELAPGLAAVLDDAGYLRTSPATHRLEAFFGAVLRRER